MQKKKEKHSVGQFKCCTSVRCQLNVGLALQNGLELSIKICMTGKENKL